MASLTIPSLLTGTIIGVSLNRFFPDLFLLLCLTGLVIFTFTKIFNRAKRLRKEENERLENLSIPLIDEDGSPIGQYEL